MKYPISLPVVKSCRFPSAGFLLESSHASSPFAAAISMTTPPPVGEGVASLKSS